MLTHTCPWPCLSRSTTHMSQIGPRLVKVSMVWTYEPPSSASTFNWKTLQHNSFSLYDLTVSLKSSFYYMHIRMSCKESCPYLDKLRIAKTWSYIHNTIIQVRQTFSNCCLKINKHYNIKYNEYHKSTKGFTISIWSKNINQHICKFGAVT